MDLLFPRYGRTADVPDWQTYLVFTSCNERKELKNELPRKTERLVDGKGSLEENEIIARSLSCLHQKFHSAHTHFSGRGD
jgi:hypothetical protein